MTLYRQEILDRCRFPRYRGLLPDPDTQGEVMNALCGDEITLFLKFDPERQTLARARFIGEGCALMAASAELLCEALEGKTRAELAAFSSEDLLALYGEMPSPSRLKCVLLPREALTRGLGALPEEHVIE